MCAYLKRTSVVALLAAVGLAFAPPADASTLLGTGTAALLGGDLTDPEDDGLPDADVNYNATFCGNDEPGFGGGEHAFNVFDNRVGGGNDKWCCGPGGGIPAEGLYVCCKLDAGERLLTHFTLASGNDTPGRRPSVWEVRGSSNGVDWDTIIRVDDTNVDAIAYNGDSDGDGTVWSDNNQVIRFDAGVDYPVPSSLYNHYRFVTFDTPLNPSGAYFQLGEIEYFGVIPEPATCLLLSAAAGGLGVYARRRRRA